LSPQDRCRLNHQLVFGKCAAPARCCAKRRSRNSQPMATCGRQRVLANSARHTRRNKTSRVIPSGNRRGSDYRTLERRRLQIQRAPAKPQRWQPSQNPSAAGLLLCEQGLHGFSGLGIRGAAAYDSAWDRFLASLRKSDLFFDADQMPSAVVGVMAGSRGSAAQGSRLQTHRVRRQPGRVRLPRPSRKESFRSLGYPRRTAVASRRDG
jgi:hypothetical protein